MPSILCICILLQRSASNQRHLGRIITHIDYLPISSLRHLLTCRDEMGSYLGILPCPLRFFKSPVGGRGPRRCGLRPEMSDVENLQHIQPNQLPAAWAKKCGSPMNSGAALMMMVMESQGNTHIRVRQHSS
ncbi:hypothetical protein F4778DRAFT_232322 [Xylariomycetidae sp. FL2044]|nr:hypothetical protein F4778DRAFT_232322 [Xylariomycetidae sp. FL2044]